MYTWGYVKDAILAKLYMNEEEARRANFLDAFPIYANECLTQIASTIRPKQASYKFEVFIKQDWERIYNGHYTNIVDHWKESELFDPDEDEDEDLDLEEWLAIHKEDIEQHIKNNLMKDQFTIGDKVSMPEDFIQYNGQSMVFQKVHYEEYQVSVRFYEKVVKTEVNPENVKFIGEKQLIPLVAGEYIIEYDAWWKPILENILDKEELETPRDVTDCIAPYVVSKLWLVDDIQRSAIFRNEFELAFARINNADYRDNNHLVPEGGW